MRPRDAMLFDLDERRDVPPFGHRVLWCDENLALIEAALRLGPPVVGALECMADYVPRMDRHGSGLASVMERVAVVEVER